MLVVLNYEKRLNLLDLLQKTNKQKKTALQMKRSQPAHHKQTIHSCVHASCKAAGCQGKEGRQPHTCEVVGNRALGEAH